MTVTCYLELHDSVWGHISNFYKINETRWGAIKYKSNYHYFLFSLNPIQIAPTTSTSSGPLSKKVTQKGYFKWNKDFEHVLAKEVFRAHANKNTKASSMKVKWQILESHISSEGHHSNCIAESFQENNERP